MDHTASVFLLDEDGKFRGTISHGTVVTFPRGALTRTVEIAIVDDAADETDETFQVVLASVTGDAEIDDDADTVTVTITDDDAPAPAPVATLSPKAMSRPSPVAGRAGRQDLRHGSFRNRERRPSIS